MRFRSGFRPASSTVVAPLGGLRHPKVHFPKRLWPCCGREPATSKGHFLSLVRSLPQSTPELENRASLPRRLDRKSTRLNSSHQIISYAVFCFKKKKTDCQHVH